jgi:hypothetical protein
MHLWVGALMFYTIAYSGKVQFFPSVFTFEGPPELVSGTYSTQSVSVLGAQYAYGLYEFQFNQEIFYSRIVLSLQSSSPVLQFRDRFSFLPVNARLS